MYDCFAPGATRLVLSPPCGVPQLRGANKRTHTREETTTTHTQTQPQTQHKTRTQQNPDQILPQAKLGYYRLGLSPPSN